MRFLVLTLLLATVCRAADVPGSDIIGGPYSAGGKVPVLKYFPGVYVRVYQILIGKEACFLIVSTAVNNTPAGEVQNTTTQVVCPK
jgi:hypothetical protein